MYVCPKIYIRRALSEYVTVAPRSQTCTILPQNLADTDPPPCKTSIFQSIFTRSASAVTPSKKVQLTLIGSRIQDFDLYRSR